MRLPLSWLYEWLHCAQPLDLDQLIGDLERLGIEIDGIAEETAERSDLKIAVVRRIAPAPNAPERQRIGLFDGTDEFEIDSDTGQWQTQAKVVVAPAGGLAGQRGSIGPSVCSWSDLNLVAATDEIIVLHPDAPIGANPSDLLGDRILELSLTPNLGHCASVRGLARALVQLDPQNRRLYKPSERGEGKFERSLSPIRVEIASLNCTRLGSVVVALKKSAKSPIWLRRRLQQCGLRSNHPAVDVTNYTMLELGQPLHGYALDALGGELRLASAKSAQRFFALDGQELELEAGDLIATGADGQIAGLAGILGAQRSAVEEGCSRVLIEAAHFLPSAIQRTSRRLCRPTDAAKFFARGCDPLGIHLALRRAVQLLTACGLEGASEVHIAEASPYEPRFASCRFKTASGLLGELANEGRVLQALERAEFDPQSEEAGVRCRIPSYRFDISEEVDLIAEVARHIGIRALTPRAGRWRASEVRHDPERQLESTLRRRCLQLGFCEILTNSLISVHWHELAQNAGAKAIFETLDPLVVQRPKSSEHQVLRTQLLAPFLQVLARNQTREVDSLECFEIARVYGRDGNGGMREISALGLLMASGNGEKRWGSLPSVSFYDFKGRVEGLLEQLGIQTRAFNPSQCAAFHPGRQADIELPSGLAGVIGQVHPKLAERIGIRHDAYFCQLSLPALFADRHTEILARSPSPFPSSDRDWTATLPRDLPFAQLADLIPSRDLLFSVQLLGIYQSPQLGDDRKNVTLRFRYASEVTTLSQVEVDREHNAVLTALIERLGGDLIDATLLP